MIGQNNYNTLTHWHTCVPLANISIPILQVLTYKVCAVQRFIPGQLICHCYSSNNGIALALQEAGSWQMLERMSS